MEAPQRASVHLAGGGHDVAEPHSSGLWPNHPFPGACPNAVSHCIWTHPGLPQPGENNGQDHRARSFYSKHVD